METKRKLASAVAAAVILLLAAAPAWTATPEEIQTSIGDGIEWLVAQQYSDGSWHDGSYVSATAFAVIKLEEYAFELGYESPFDPDYAYHANVEAGLNYIFTNANMTAISPQPAGDPDTDGDGLGICFSGGGNLRHRHIHDGHRSQQGARQNRHQRASSSPDL